MGKYFKSFFELISDEFLAIAISFTNANMIADEPENEPLESPEQPIESEVNLERPKLLIVIGQSEEIIIDFIQEVIQDMIGTDYDLEFIATHSPETIFEISNYRKVDLYFLMLNNLIHTSDQFPGNSNAEQSLSLITALKMDRVTPIIAFSGIASAAARAVSAGADHLLPYPFSIAELTHCTKSALKLDIKVE